MTETRKVFIFVDRASNERKHELAESEIAARMKLSVKNGMIRNARRPVRHARSPSFPI